MKKSIIAAALSALRYGSRLQSRLQVLPVRSRPAVPTRDKGQAVYVERRPRLSYGLQYSGQQLFQAARYWYARRLRRGVESARRRP